MANLLGRDIRPEEKIMLAALAAQPGFVVLRKLAAECCGNATANVVKVDPAAPNYTDLLKSAQLIARAMNEFSANLFASCGWHSDESKVDQKAEQLMSQIR